MEDRKLYPMKFCALQDDYSWGSETFRLADLGYRDSLVREGWLAGNSISELMDMYMDQMVGENAFNYWGRQFPLCIRDIKVTGKMPLRVHPDDESAQQRWDFLGKEKVWYVLDCSKDSSVMLGFRKDTDATEVCSRCADCTVGDILNIVAPYPGQMLHIAPGTPHAACGNIEILEVSESSPLDFCMCSWGKEVSDVEFDPALDFVDVLDLMDYRRFAEKPSSCFEISKLLLSGPVKVSRGENDGFVVLNCLSGRCEIQTENAPHTLLEKGESLLVPADCPDFALVPTCQDTRIMRVEVPYMSEKDSYINPAAQETLPDED